MKDVMFNKLNG